MVRVSGGQSQLQEDGIDALFHRAGADDEGGRNGGVGAPFGHQAPVPLAPGP